MQKVVLIFLAVLVGGGALAGIASSVSEFTWDLPQAKKLGARVVVTEHGAIVQRKVSLDEHPGEVTIDSPTHDFGLMDAFATGSHTFVLRNEGTGSVTLKNLGTSCTKCTIANISQSVLLPGEEARVQIDWNAGPGPHYSQTATIGIENDPRQKSLQLRVAGRVRTRLGAEAEELSFGSLAPGKEATLSTHVYSQLFASAEVLSVKCSREEIQATLEDAAESKLGDLEPTWVRKLNITIPASMPTGPFEETVYVRVAIPEPINGERELTLDVRVKGKVRKGIAFLGNGLDERGVLELGLIYRGVAKETRLKVKVQDPTEPRLLLKEIERYPEFLQVELTPTPGVPAEKGMWDLRITIPADAPVCNFMGPNQLGQVRLVTEHPRIGDVPLAIQFSVKEEE